MTDFKPLRLRATIVGGHLITAFPADGAVIPASTEAGPVQWVDGVWLPDARLEALEEQVRKARRLIDGVMGDTDPDDDDAPLLRAHQLLIETVLDLAALRDGTTPKREILDGSEPDEVAVYRRWAACDDDYDPDYITRADMRVILGHIDTLTAALRDGTTSTDSARDGREG